MGKYQIEVKETAQKELKEIYKSGNKSSIQKIEKIPQNNL
jgi:uncharacterized membrane protein (DUF106 family)